MWQPRSAVRDLGIVIGVALGALFLWATLSVDFVIFAGVLLAIFLHGLAEALSRRTGVSRGWSLALVVLAIAALLIGCGYMFAEAIASQVDQLSDQLSAAASRLQQQIGDSSWAKPFLASSNLRDLASAGTIGRLLGVASNAVVLIGSLVVIAFFGVYLSAEPELYRRGVLALCPSGLRHRVSGILTGIAEMLWYWILGRLFSMAIVGVCTTLGLWALGMPLPVVLGGLAGILTFVPYIGSLASAIPSLVIALSVDPSRALWIVILYLGVHILEGYILVPLVQRRAAELPPAFTLAMQLLLGAIAGIVGVMFATPLAAALVVIVRKGYVEETPTDGSNPGDGADSGRKTTADGRL